MSLTRPPHLYITILHSPPEEQNKDNDGRGINDV